MVYNRTVYLNSDNQIISDYAPFDLTIDPRTLSLSHKIRMIEYIWGDGTSDIVKFKPVLGSDNRLPISNEIGDPRNYPKTKEFYSKDLSLSTYVVNVNVYVFGSSDIVTFTILLNLKNPPMDYGVDKFFNEIHLIKTKMFGPDNKILYTFQTQNENNILMSLVNWKLKPKPIISADKLSKPYNYIYPFTSKFKTLTSANVNNEVTIIPYEKTTIVNPDLNPIPQIQPTPTVTPTITPTVTRSLQIPTPTPSITPTITHTPTVTPTPTLPYGPSLVIDTLYTSFDSVNYNMKAYLGRNVALQIPSNINVNRAVIDYIIYKLDKAYDFYYRVIGEYPLTLVTLRGKDPVSVVNTTCGSGCGELGRTGIELLRSSWDALYSGVNLNNQFDQVLFYELGRNFWVDSLRRVDATPSETVTTGFAVFMRFMSMDSAGVNGAPFNGTPFNDFKYGVINLINTYIADPSYNFMNTVYDNIAPTNALSLQGTDMFASFMFDLYNKFGDQFLLYTWSNIKQINITSGSDIENACDTFALAVSQAVNADLYNLFSTYYRWPVSASLASYTSIYPPYTP
jgi:hypothetical protein